MGQGSSLGWWSRSAGILLSLPPTVQCYMCLHDSKLVCSYYPAQRVLWRTKHGFCLSTLWDPESSSGHQVWQQVPSPAEPSRWLSSHLLYVLDKVSFCSPGCPGIHYVAQAGLRFTATFLSRPPNSGIPSLCHLPQ